MRPFTLRRRLPKYKAYEALRDQLIEYLAEQKPQVGDPFPSVSQLQVVTKLSYVTVHKALVELNREGWVERKVGRGTFVGPRLEMPVIPQRAAQKGTRSMVRLGMLNYAGPTGLAWYTRLILEGIEKAAQEQALSVEPLTSPYDDRPQSQVRRRLTQNPPDVLACIAPDDRPPYALGDALNADIPCIVVGPRCPEFGIPNIYGDTISIAAESIRYLADRGHKRIGLLLETMPCQLIFDRREGYLRGLDECGIGVGDDLIHWMSWRDSDEMKARSFVEYLRRSQPTAVLVGYCECIERTASLMEQENISIPKDLSMVFFGPWPETRYWVKADPTCAAIPWVDIGGRAAEIARDIIDGQGVPDITELPCSLVEGETVRDIRE